MSHASGVQPPRTAVWLIDLFVLEEQAESIPGDLLEEFSERALRSGVASARRWYWRQSIKAAVDLAVAGVHDSPLLIVSIMLVGYLLLGFCLSMPERIIDAVIHYFQHGVVSYWSGTWLFWFNTAILSGRFVVSLFIGCIVAYIAKRREIIAGISLGVVWAVVGAIFTLQWIIRYWPDSLVFMNPWTVTFIPAAIGVVTGATFVRVARSRAYRRLGAGDAHTVTLA